MGIFKKKHRTKQNTFPKSIKIIKCKEFVTSNISQNYVNLFAQSGQGANGEGGGGRQGIIFSPWHIHVISCV